MYRTGQMEWHQTPENHVFDTIPLILLQLLPRTRSPQLRCQQPPVPDIGRPSLPGLSSRLWLMSGVSQYKTLFL